MSRRCVAYGAHLNGADHEFMVVDEHVCRTLIVVGGGGVDEAVDLYQPRYEHMGSGTPSPVTHSF
eukprot:scaffold285645_cov29-Tisochrysis_lutea.AAC.1